MFPTVEAVVMAITTTVVSTTTMEVSTTTTEDSTTIMEDLTTTMVAFTMGDSATVRLQNKLYNRNDINVKTPPRP